MKPSKLAVVLCVVAAVVSTSAQADKDRKRSKDALRAGSGMKVVANRATVGQPGYQWRYFADRRHGTAVVISPGGDYFYSDGRGLNLVFKGTAA